LKVEEEFILKITPTLEEVKKFSQQNYKIVPVSCEILSDIATPIKVLKILKKTSAHCFLLESVERQESWGRYTFLGFNPKLCITCTRGEMQIGDKKISTENPAAEIRKILADYKSPRIENLPTFTGGLVGYFAYDFITYAEPTLQNNLDDEENFQDFDLMLFDKIIAFDNLKQKIFLIANIFLDDAEKNYQTAVAELAELKNLILRGEKISEPAGKILSEITPLFDKKNYCEMVEKAKNYIREGDIFQVVLSNRLSAEFEGSLLNTYRILRTLNPSPYMFYFSGTDMEVAGASPETLVKLENGILHTFPLAGTRPRGKNSAEDLRLEKDLLSDEKELAEHNMLVDLGRNDLGKISKFGTVEVEKLHAIEKFSHVMHIGSVVRGEIESNFDALAAVATVLPAGTLSGAPKIRACEIISELEQNKRGIYGGAFGYIDFSGNLDTAIAIRIIYKKNGKIFVRSGAGIVADSVPEKEFEECLNKAKACLKALELAEVAE